MALPSRAAAPCRSRAVGKGTSITLFLPRAAEEPPAAPFNVTTSAPLRAAAGILVVEDDAEVARVTMEVLREIGCRPVEARDGHAALAAIEQDPTIELVLSDIAMPGGMSGLDLARTLRNLRPGLPIVLATGCAQWRARAENGEFTFIAKPYRREALTAALRTAFERGKGREPVTAPTTKKTVGPEPTKPSLVEPRGIEPLTFALRTRRSPS